MTQFVLKHPVTINGETITELTFRRPKGRDLKFAQAGGGGEMDLVFRLFGNLCDREPALIEEFDMVDVLRLNSLFEDWGIDPKSLAS